MFSRLSRPREAELIRRAIEAVPAVMPSYVRRVFGGLGIDGYEGEPAVDVWLILSDRPPRRAFGPASMRRLRDLVREVFAENDVDLWVHVYFRTQSEQRYLGRLVDRARESD